MPQVEWSTQLLMMSGTSKVRISWVLDAVSGWACGLPLASAVLLVGLSTIRTTPTAGEVYHDSDRCVSPRPQLLGAYTDVSRITTRWTSVSGAVHSCRCVSPRPQLSGACTCRSALGDGVVVRS
ncbi:hypothetical protein CONLIGDRAFT_107580 [Coniochaeta ligniaria NRRL 30616]|uniref:Uncharacterized protein n=1 Tax=Coniochaeta ligniaria NRRL 30616 TaxID=1408157 RepID=A0A1J7I9Q5_9PEZI|nr:hypothetical protein CONLIGDRAFT_107580 [Coniochaeta ligniaria NRRL 30616]